MSRLPFPPILSAKLAAFFEARCSGTIIIQARDGEVMTYEIHEKGSVKRDEAGSLVYPARVEG